MIGKGKKGNGFMRRNRKGLTIPLLLMVCGLLAILLAACGEMSPANIVPVANAAEATTTPPATQPGSVFDSLPPTATAVIAPTATPEPPKTALPTVTPLPPTATPDRHGYPTDPDQSPAHADQSSADGYSQTGRDPGSG
jgi:hypothetical protein